MMLSKEEIGGAVAVSAGTAPVYSTRVLDAIKASPHK
jgi:hypothetical protein